MSDDTALKVLSANLSRLLEERGISQRELARRTGDSVMTISSIVRGKHMPGAGVITRLAEQLDVGLDSLLGDHQKKSRRSA